MRAISALSLLAGMSTRACFADTPLRIRVSMSEIGSVIGPLSLRRQSLRSSLLRLLCSGFSPGALRPPGHIAFERQLPEAEPAHVELAHEGPRTPAQAAPVPVTDLVFQRLGFLGDLCCRSHSLVLVGYPSPGLVRTEGHAEHLQQLPG